MTICPVCRHKDQTCKVRFLGDAPFFSCQSCFEREERNRPKRRDDEDALRRLGYREREPTTR
jgi:hypothetical protein